MAKTQLVKCISCGTPLANINTETGDIRLITIKRTEEGEIPLVQNDSNLNLTDNHQIVCSCGVTNGIY